MCTLMVNGTKMEKLVVIKFYSVAEFFFLIKSFKDALKKAKLFCVPCFSVVMNFLNAL